MVSGHFRMNGVGCKVIHRFRTRPPRLPYAMSSGRMERVAMAGVGLHGLDSKAGVRLSASGQGILSKLIAQIKKVLPLNAGFHILIQFIKVFSRLRASMLVLWL